MFSPEIRVAIVSQLGQKSTQMAIISAIALLVGWQVAPEKLDAIATLLTVLNAVALAAVQERRGTLTTTTTVVADPPLAAVVSTTTTREDVGATPTP